MSFFLTMCIYARRRQISKYLKQMRKHCNTFVRCLWLFLSMFSINDNLIWKEHKYIFTNRNKTNFNHITRLTVQIASHASPICCLSLRIKCPGNCKKKNNLKSSRREIGFHSDRKSHEISFEKKKTKIKCCDKMLQIEIKVLETIDFVCWICC